VARLAAMILVEAAGPSAFASVIRPASPPGPIRPLDVRPRLRALAGFHLFRVPNDLPTPPQGQVGDQHRFREPRRKTVEPAEGGWAALACLQPLAVMALAGGPRH